MFAYSGLSEKVVCFLDSLSASGASRGEERGACEISKRRRVEALGKNTDCAFLPVFVNRKFKNCATITCTSTWTVE